MIEPYLPSTDEFRALAEKIGAVLIAYGRLEYFLGEIIRVQIYAKDERTVDLALNGIEFKNKIEFIENSIFIDNDESFVYETNKMMKIIKCKISPARNRLVHDHFFFRKEIHSVQNRARRMKMQSRQSAKMTPKPKVSISTKEIDRLLQAIESASRWCGVLIHVLTIRRDDPDYLNFTHDLSVYRGQAEAALKHYRSTTQP